MGRLLILAYVIAIILLAACDTTTHAWVPPPTRTPGPTKTLAAWQKTATAKVTPRTPTPTRTPTRTRTPTATRTPIPAATNTPNPGTCDPPVFVGSQDFQRAIEQNIATVIAVNPADRAIVKNCRIRRFVEDSSPYSDWTGTIRLPAATGNTYASLVLHEAYHIVVAGWNQPGGSCWPEDRTLEYQAQWLDRAGEHGLAAWYRQQKGKWNCPA